MAPTDKRSDSSVVPKQKVSERRFVDTGLGQGLYLGQRSPLHFVVSRVCTS